MATVNDHRSGQSHGEGHHITFISVYTLFMLCIALMANVFGCVLVSHLLYDLVLGSIRFVRQFSSRFLIHFQRPEITDPNSDPPRGGSDYTHSKCLCLFLYVSLFVWVRRRNRYDSVRFCGKYCPSSFMMSLRTSYRDSPLYHHHT